MTMTGLSEANARLHLIRTLPDKYLREAVAAMTDRQKEFGKRVRQARDDKGWKQKELAAAVHVEPTTVSRWERGDSVPDLDKIALLAKVLGRPITFFVNDGAASAASLDDARVRQLVREELEGALAPTNALIERLLHQADLEQTANGSEGQ